MCETWAEDKALGELLAADVNKGVGGFPDGVRGSRTGEDDVVGRQRTEGRSSVRRAYDSCCGMAEGEVKVLSVGCLEKLNLAKKNDLRLRDEAGTQVFVGPAPKPPNYDGWISCGWLLGCGPILVPLLAGTKYLPKG